MVEESKKILGGPLALVSKVSEVETVDKKDSDEEGFLMNPDDEAVAFYSNNQVRKFFKKPFNLKVKQSEVKGNFVSKSGANEKKKFKNSFYCKITTRR